MNEKFILYGLWKEREDDFQGGWMRDTTGRFLSSRCRGEMVAQQKILSDTVRSYVARFGDDGNPVIEDEDDSNTATSQ